MYRVLEFNQSQWLKQYVESNTRKRIEAEENGVKDGKALYKLIKNVAYGKTMENVRNRIDIKLVSNKKDYLKRTSKPICMSHKVLDSDLVAICRNNVSFTLNKPAYDYIKNKYGGNSRLFFTGTDILMYEIETEDVYKDFSNDKEMFDFIDYSTKSKYYDNHNKLVVGEMKEQTAGVLSDEFVRLNSKMHAYLVVSIKRQRV